MAEKKPVDELSGTPTTGHEWDGIRELNTPLPRWWLWTFYATIVWAIVYWVLMPSWPGITGYYHGLLGYSSRAAIEASTAAAHREMAAMSGKIAAAPLVEIEKTPALLDFALAAGKSAFSVNCSQCHGADAAGHKGFPNLNDDDWLWGGTLDQIAFTITHGARNGNDPGARDSQMPRFLTDGILTREQIGDVADYVLSLSGQPHDAAAATRGKPLFADNCAACHGDKGQGNQEVGAPRLSDHIWLYGGDRATIIQTISFARNGVMPNWGARLDPVTIKELAVYVHSLGGGQ
ncbi:MAG TPA: cytochrome-c oxidase, cbb3-type subunit III [Dongiaceae bacterium]|nr:cytochrome-c oxidase, cbb3-type subunit III [Dongiaceae bacterium]